MYREMYLTDRRFNMISKAKKYVAVLLLFVCVCMIFSPQTAYASEDSSQHETVKVGFFAMDGYHVMDEEGNRSGYGYDFLRLMARYWDVDYEYVGYDKSWDDMQQMLEEAGYEIVPFSEKADVYVINTCSVTNMADRKSRQMLHRAKKLNPDAAVVAVGCYVQTKEDEAKCDEAIDILPQATIRHIGMYRDEKTLNPVWYYNKVPMDTPNPENFYVYITDPMLATGNSLLAAIDLYAGKGIPIKNIKCLCIIAAPQGIENIQKHYPDIEIITAAVDDHLNEKGYIVPGLGDAGDRLFGTNE